MNQLMAIPEVQQIIEAKFVELGLVLKNKLKPGQEQEQEQPPGEPKTSNIIQFPLPHKKYPEEKENTANNIDGTNRTESGTSQPTIINIVDASGYRYTPEEEQVKIFMDYFNNHQMLRRAILDEFFLRILPYSNLMVK
jgi:hypothetical protein